MALAGTGLGRSVEQLGRAANDLVMRDIFEVLGQTPPVSERVDDLTVTKIQSPRTMASLRPSGDQAG
jgi:hypothetical protein